MRDFVAGLNTVSISEHKLVADFLMASSPVSAKSDAVETPKPQTNRFTQMHNVLDMLQGEDIEVLFLVPTTANLLIVPKPSHGTIKVGVPDVLREKYGCFVSLSTVFADFSRRLIATEAKPCWIMISPSHPDFHIIAKHAQEFKIPVIVTDINAIKNEIYWKVVALNTSVVYEGRVPI